MFPQPMTKFSSIFPRRTSLALLCVPLLLVGCSKKWKLMPTPLAHQFIGEAAYSDLSESQRSQDMEVFYATNRPGGENPDAPEYDNGIVDKLHLGISTVRLGEPGLNWRDLVDLSTLRERKAKVPLTLGETHQIDSLPDTSGKEFAASINKALATCHTKDITIYVHGAKSTFLRSTVQGAQFYHFMTRDTAFIAYSWPSTGKFISYKKDIEFAAQSAPNLADLIEYLAANTRAKKINLLSYSAGGQVVAPGLALLRDRYPDMSAAALKRKLRIGDIYFAAADVGLRKFTTEYLPKFSDIVDNVTLTFHEKDWVLGFAQSSHNEESRLGRPDSGELSEEEIKWLEKLAKEHKLDVLDMEFSTAERPVNFKAHGHWYLNEWVSSDAILQFLFHENPARRGLMKKPDSEVWYFPPDYPERLKELIRVELEAREREGS
jgi:esterase/lipase superfamily enzyme